MTRGYIVIAQNNDTTDYLEQAYALALNLKLTQSKVNSLTVCVDAKTKKLIKAKHKEAFDNIVDIPWQDDAKEQDWKINNKWKYYYMTPYDETVILDTDMIFPTDVSHWWDIMSQRDVWATTKVRTYRGEIVTSNFYRKYFAANNLPNVYTAFFYFKKSDLASELFAMIEIIFQHWQRMFFKYMPEGKPDWLSGDVAYALAMQLLGIEADCILENIDEEFILNLDCVITLCAEEVCPRVPTSTRLIHWPNEDPDNDTYNHLQSKNAFDKTRDNIFTLLKKFMIDNL